MQKLYEQLLKNLLDIFKFFKDENNNKGGDEDDFEEIPLKVNIKSYSILSECYLYAILSDYSLDVCLWWTT